MPRSGASGPASAFLIAAGLIVGAPAAEAQHADGPLTGPRVGDPPFPTIVRRNLYGELQKPEGTPEEAVAALLGLDPDSRAAVERVFLRRMQSLDRWVAENAGLIVRLRRASDDTPVAERIWLVLEALKAVEPLVREPALWDQVRAVLPTEQAERFDRAMSEYWDAVALDAVSIEGRQRSPGVLQRLAVVSQERVAIIGREINLCFETLGDSGPLAVTALTSFLDLSDAQRRQLAVMAADYDLTADMPPSDGQKRWLVVKVLSILGPAQRDQVLRLYRGG